MAMNKMIYLDNAATTKTDPKVLEAMEPFLSDFYGNPSSSYSFAARARSAIGRAREQVAGLIGAEKDEIYFTSGGTEADNAALWGMYRLKASSGKKINIVSQNTEHPAVLNTLKGISQLTNAQVRFAGCDESGYVGLDNVKQHIDSSTAFISIMAANNEIGTINDFRRIGEYAGSSGILFHTDAVQAVGHIPINVKKDNIDLLSASAHKFHGPKGIGFLYVRRGIKLPSFIFGGGQERGLISGTENVAGIIGLGKASEIAAENLEADSKRICSLRDRMIKEVLSAVPGTIVTGAQDSKLRTPGSVSFAFADISGSSLLVQLDMKGICASTGSACSASSMEPSHVLKACNLSDKYINGSVRFSLSKYTTEEEIEYVVQNLSQCIDSLRRIVGADY